MTQTWWNLTVAGESIATVGWGVAVVAAVLLQLVPWRQPQFRAAWLTVTRFAAGALCLEWARHQLANPNQHPAIGYLRAVAVVLLAGWLMQQAVVAYRTWQAHDAERHDGQDRQVRR